MKNKQFLFILIIFLSNALFAEVFSVPGFNYSINPLEGWILQPYEYDSELSWLSGNSSIALSVSAWNGDEYQDLKIMFNDLTKDLDAYGNFVPLNYLGRKSAIGEITFKIQNQEYKGWSLFVNGDDFDYYITAFAIMENYEESYSEIQSVLDSFSIGIDGELSPGPISSFINESPNRKFKNYTVDFFDHPLVVSAAEYDFGSAQSIIEREANVMLNYSNDPENFYNAWVRYYKLIFRDNYLRLDPLFVSLYPYFADDKYTDYGLTEILMFWIQGFKYGRSLDKESDLLNPLESSLTKIGDCDARSMILGILLHKFGVKSLLLTSEKVKHAIIAVDCPGEGAKYVFNGKEYLMVELTTKALIGEVKESFIDPGLWTPVEMEYSNGF